MNIWSSLPKSDKSDFSKLSKPQQTLRLHEQFRYRYASILQNANLSDTPKDFEVAAMIGDLYNEWEGSSVNFVQIGACDGNWRASNDPIQRLILTKPEWHGVMMEPVPSLFQTLTANIDKEVVQHRHRIIPINAALSDEDGEQPFFVVNSKFAEEAPEQGHALKHQIGSFKKEHILKHLVKLKDKGQLKEDLDDYIDQINVQSMTPNLVIQRFKESGKAARDGSVDVLIIDAEGFDLVVLQKFMEDTSIRPLLLIYESLHLNPEQTERAQALLKSNGYLHFLSGWNSFGVRVANI